MTELDAPRDTERPPRLRAFPTAGPRADVLHADSRLPRHTRLRAADNGELGPLIRLLRSDHRRGSQQAGRIGAGVSSHSHFGGPHTSSRHTVAAVQHGRSGSRGRVPAAPPSREVPQEADGIAAAQRTGNECQEQTWPGKRRVAMMPKLGAGSNSDVTRTAGVLIEPECLAAL
jgi:hypothetical protein